MKEKPLKTIVAGSRGITNYEYVKAAIEYCGWEVSEIVSGGAYGVDKLGERWARENNIPIKQFIPEWKNITGKPANEIGENKYGQYWKRAGIVRNIQMADYADALVAIWDGKSTGTQHMIRNAEEKKLKVYVLKLPE